MQNDASSVYGSRVRPHQGETGAAEMEIEDESDRNLEQDLSAVDGFGEHMDLIPSMLTARATKMFTGGAGGARASGEPAVATFVTPWLIKLAKETVWQLFDLHREDVQSSWGEPIDREEATGYLVMDALGIQILPDEARKLGKKAVKTVYEPKRGVKAKDESIKSAAAAKRAKARRAAERSDERRAGLQQRLAEIDAQRDADRAALWSEELDWQLPEGPLVSPPAGTQSVDPAAAAAAAEDAELAAAEAAIKAAEVADAAAAQALADAERAARATLSMIPALGVPGCTSPLELLTWIVQQQEEHEARDEWPTSKLYGKACELWTVVEPLVDAVDRAMGKKMDTAHDVTRAKRARLAAVERAHERAMEVQAEEVRRAAAETKALQAEMAKNEAAVAESEQRLSENERQLAVVQARLRELEAGQRVALHAHARHVWGAGWQQRPDKPVVFNLTGKSASEVAAMAGCVSQEETPTEERRALNELNSGLLRVGS